MDCECKRDSGKADDMTYFTHQCLIQKMTFTANLLAIRIICDNMDNQLFNKKYVYPIFNQGKYIE